MEHLPLRAAILVSNVSSLRRGGRGTVSSWQFFMKIEDWEQSNFLRYGNSFVLVSKPQLFKRWINLCPVDNAIDIPNTYALGNYFHPVDRTIHLLKNRGSGHYHCLKFTFLTSFNYSLDSRRMSNLRRK